MAVEAVNGLLKKRGIGPEEIDLMIVATVTPDRVFPATANIICDADRREERLGLRPQGGVQRLPVSP